MKLGEIMTKELNVCKLLDFGFEIVARGKNNDWIDYERGDWNIIYNYRERQVTMVNATDEHVFELLNIDIEVPDGDIYFSAWEYFKEWCLDFGLNIEEAE